jgi:hypothetical protein
MSAMRDFRKNIWITIFQILGVPIIALITTTLEDVNVNLIPVKLLNNYQDVELNIITGILAL